MTSPHKVGCDPQRKKGEIRTIQVYPFSWANLEQDFERGVLDSSQAYDSSKESESLV